jgi:hypothetical protein
VSKAKKDFYFTPEVEITAIKIHPYQDALLEYEGLD